MTSDYGLTTGALKGILSKSEHNSWINKPITVQVTNLKSIESRDANEPARYRVLISDGAYAMHGVCSADTIPHLDSQGFKRLSIITIKSYDLVKTQKRIMVITDADVKAPVSNKSDTVPTACDTYFNEHPEDDYLELTSADKATSKSPAPPSAIKSNRHVNPIESLTPYQNNWTIKARISFKSDIKKWQNAKGEGKLFNVNFLDESDEIRATAFNEVAEKLYHELEEGKVYYVSKARLVQSKPQFSRLSHLYELSLDRDTVIEECFDDAQDVPKLNFNFTKLDSIEKLDPNSIVDVIGVLREVKPVFQITAKSTGKPFDRRDVTIVDDTNFSISVGLWNTTAVDFSIPEGSVVALKGCKVSDFGGRSLTLTQAGSLLPNPDTPEAYSLKGWYDHQGSKENFKTLKTETTTSKNYIATRKTIGQAEEEHLGFNEKADYFSVKATVNYFKTDNFCYPACNNVPAGAQNSNTCNRKLIETDGSWRCEKCEMNFDEPYYRYILNCSIMDHSGQLWTTLFDSEALKLFGRPASELLKLKESGDPDFAKVLEGVTMREFNFRLRARQDTYNGQVRVRYQSVNVSDVDFEAECTYLSTQLESML